MGAVMIRCPRTGASVPTGVVVQGNSLDGVTHKITRMRCVSCGSEHAWARGLAWVAIDAAAPAAKLRPLQAVRAMERKAAPLPAPVARAAAALTRPAPNLPAKPEVPPSSPDEPPTRWTWRLGRRAGRA